MQNELGLYLNRLKELRTKFADASLRQPNNKTEFGYGEACGEYKGLLRAEQLLEQVIGEVANDEDE